MKRTACKYAIVRFVPFVETGEFANVGIVMIAPKQRFFGFELELKRYGRVTQFFDDVDAKLYRKSLYNLKEELERVADVLKAHGFDRRLKDNDVDFTQGLFNEIVRPRETVVRFGEVRTVLAEDPKRKLRELFEFYIERNFATKKYKETLLESNVRKLLFRIDVGQYFDREKIGSDLYHVTFPFVRHDRQGQFPTVIKPLHLGHDEPTKIIEHGDAWINRLIRLKGKYLQPDRVLFALSGPEGGQQRLEAFNDIEQELMNIGARTTNVENVSEITDFVTR